MGSSDTTISSSPPHHSLSPNSSSSSPPPTHNNVVVASPCAACKILRRRCAEKCVLAPYFPPTDPLKFTTAHRVFGASNIIKFLLELPESQRADAVSSMVYEANARLRDPVYGCAGAICHLQKQVDELQAQLAKAKAELVNMKCQHSNLMALICMELAQQSPQASAHQPPPNNSFENITASSPQNNLQNYPSFGDENSVGSMWLESLWA